MGYVLIFVILAFIAITWTVVKLYTVFKVHARQN